MFKKIRTRFASWRLDRAIRAGRAHRGRVLPPQPPRFRPRWEEFKLRLRTLRAAVAFLFYAKSDDDTFTGAVFPTGRLYAKKVDSRGDVIEDHGLISTKVVTNAGVAFIVDAFQDIVELEVMKYHGSGTDTTAENATDTALGTEVATRATGTTAEGASANIYRTVGTVNYTGTHAITEHGVFSASSTGVLLDRSVFSAINVINGDAIQFTYELTLPAGS